MFMGPIKRLLRDEQGVSAIEYCVLMAFVAVTLIFAFNSVSGGIASTFAEAEAGLAGSGDTGDDDDNDDEEEEGEGGDGDG